MATLGETFSRKVSPQLTEIYWHALKHKWIDSIERAADWCIRSSEHFPRPTQLLEAIGNASRITTTFVEPPWHGSESLRRINLGFLAWMGRRILSTKKSIPPDELARRRVVCNELAGAHEMLLAERDPEATHARLTAMLDAAMARVDHA